MSNDEFRQLPPTPENLERIGWWKCTQYFHAPESHIPVRNKEPVMLLCTFDLTEWWLFQDEGDATFGVSIDISTPATMGDVLDWHKLLGIPVKEITT